MRIQFDDNKFRICYKCFDRIAKELRETNPTHYQQKLIIIVKAETCELCNKSNIFKI